MEDGWERWRYHNAFGVGILAALVGCISIYEIEEQNLKDFRIADSSPMLTGSNP